MKYCSLILLLFLFSCGNKEDILLPKSNVTIVSEVVDHSPIYIFFRTKGNDTLAEVNRNNSIISTNWILNIDKRLPLRLVIPEVMKLQEKKRAEVAHKNELAENYFSYADSIGKNLAFLPFTKVYYKKGRPEFGDEIFFTKQNQILVNNVLVKREELKEYLNGKTSEAPNLYELCFDKSLSYGVYIEDKIFISSLKINYINFQEFIF